MSKAEYNRNLIREYLGAFERGDTEKGKSYWAKDARFFQAGHSHLAGWYEGPDDFMDRWISSVVDMTDGRWAVNADPEFLVMGEDGCVVIIDEHMIRSGKGRIDTKKLVVYEIEGDKVKGCRMYDGDQGAIDAFWS
jgi:ketosteroid isomerase-like protein